MADHYVRALFDFPAPERGDLMFNAHEIILVLRELDENWLCGVSNGEIGNFPKSFVEEIELPLCDHASGQKLFIATKDFPTQMQGDLGFTVGDIIHGLKMIDSNWWHGRVSEKYGIFPITHVKDLDSQPPIEQIEQHLHKFSPSVACIHPEESTTSNDSNASDQVIAIGKAILDLNPQLDDELTLHVGDIVKIIDIVDSVFAIGECNGRIGQFPLSFVDVIQGEIPPELVESKDLHKKSKFNWFKEDQPPLVDHTLSEPILRLSIVDDMNSKVSIPHQNGELKPIQSYEIELPNYHSEVVPYCQTLYPFVGENSNELTFMDNEIVTMIQHVDDHWILGELNGQQGIFPTSYVDIIVDCPWPLTELSSTLPVWQQSISEEDPDVFHDAVSELPTEYEKENESNNSRGAKPQGNVSVWENGEMYGRVLLSYRAQGDTDLNLHEGDTVTVLSKDSDFWLYVRTDDMREGYCPADHIELFAEEPAVAGLVNPEAPGILRSQSLPSSSIEFPQPSTSFQHITEFKPKPGVAPKPIPVKSTQYIGGTKSPPTSMPANANSDVKKSPSKPARPPVFTKTKSLSKDASLDDVIRQELAAAQPEQKKTISSSKPVRPNMKNAMDYSPLQLLNMPKSDSTSSKQVGLSTFYSDNQYIPQPSQLSHKLGADHSSSALLPQRPAPPRPIGMLPHGKDLMSFSPDKEPIPEFDTECKEVASDLDRRISELETDIKTYVQKKEEVLSQLTQVKEKSADAELLREALQDIDANINGLSQELVKLQENLKQLHPGRQVASPTALKAAYEQRKLVAAKRQREEQCSEGHEDQVTKRKAQHQHIVKELIGTEEEYLHSLRIAVQETTGSKPHPDVNLTLLFGNMEEVITISQKLLSCLHAATDNKSVEEQHIGQCFLDLKEDMVKVYAPYCRNHDDVISLMAKYEQNPSILVYFNDLVVRMRQNLTVFDLSAILIKPVQRILKYPLLLNELSKNTEEFHPDKVNILAAIHAMTTVASEINEFKRRKDLVRKYKADREEGFGDKLSRLTVHSTRKKLQRLSQKVVGAQTVDEKFNREEKSFRALESLVKGLNKNLSQYVSQVQETTSLMESVANDFSDFYGERTHQQTVEKYCAATNHIAINTTDNFKTEVEHLVLLPLQRLLVHFQGPAKVIKKRHDKLLDYDRLTSKESSQQATQIKEELQEARHNYEALNAQLLDELPKLIQLSKDLIHSLLKKLFELQQKFYNQSVSHLDQTLGLDLSLGDWSLDNFTITHTHVVDELSILSFIPKTFNPAVDDKKSSPNARISLCPQPQTISGVQSESQKVYLMQMYPPSRLYTLTGNYQSTRQMDLSLKAGTLVGVIKEGDPMGDKERWFVDNGVDKGFVAKKYLSAWNQASTWAAASTSSAAAGALTDPLGSLESLIPVVPLYYDPVNILQPKVIQQPETYQAVYPFQARNELEMSLQVGQCVSVKAKHDQDGNIEWWLVQCDDGKEGYVPANYLYQQNQ